MEFATVGKRVVVVLWGVAGEGLVLCRFTVLLLGGRHEGLGYAQVYLDAAS